MARGSQLKAQKGLGAASQIPKNVGDAGNNIYIKKRGIEERLTEFHKSLMHDFRTGVSQYKKGSNSTEGWNKPTEDPKFGCTAIIMQDFLVEHAFNLQTGKGRADTGR